MKVTGVIFCPYLVRVLTSHILQNTQPYNLKDIQLIFICPFVKQGILCYGSASVHLSINIFVSSQLLLQFTSSQAETWFIVRSLCEAAHIVSRLQSVQALGAQEMQWAQAVAKGSLLQLYMVPGNCTPLGRQTT